MKNTDNITRQYFTISDLAKLMSIATSQLRYYEDIGVIPRSRRSRSNTRIYTTKEAVKIQKVIRAAKSKLYTLKALRLIYQGKLTPNYPIPDQVLEVAGFKASARLQRVTRHHGSCPHEPLPQSILNHKSQILNLT